MVAPERRAADSHLRSTSELYGLAIDGSGFRYPEGKLTPVSTAYTSKLVANCDTLSPSPPIQRLAFPAITTTPRIATSSTSRPARSKPRLNELEEFTLTRVLSGMGVACWPAAVNVDGNACGEA
jgi:hypothetical protein